MIFTFRFSIALPIPPGPELAAQPGLEPGNRDPKSRVLPITPPGKEHKVKKQKISLQSLAKFHFMLDWKIELPLTMTRHPLHHKKSDRQDGLP